jgi:hypothetical protein
MVDVHGNAYNIRVQACMCDHDLARTYNLLRL